MPSSNPSLSPSFFPNRPPAVGQPHLVALVMSLLSCLSCGEQEEGERCNPLNGNLDCGNGLRCVPGTELGLESDLQGTALCCPIDPTAIRRDECRAGIDLSPDDAGAGGSAGAGGGAAGAGGSPLGGQGGAGDSQDPDGGTASGADSPDAGDGDAGLRDAG